MALEFADRIRRLPTYPVAGGYSLPAEVAQLASNESPDPPIPAVREAIAREIAGLNRYPQPSGARLRGALSARFGVPASRIAIGNGSCDVLLAAGEALLEPGAEIVHAWPSFSIYPHLAAASGARAVTVPLDAEDRHDLDAMAREVTAATRMVVVCNPNNPTSTAVPADAIAQLLADVPPHVAVVLDEAYIEFNLAADPDESVELLARHPNLVVLRTFSKAYGLAGLRVGYALCGGEAFVAAVDQVRQPFFANALAQAAAVEALKHQDAVAERVERALVARMTLDEGLAPLGVGVADSQANFSWLTLPGDAGEAEGEAAVVAGLQERGVLVRAGTALGRPGCLRVSYGSPAENDRFLAALRELL
jgi:histidinol-phosphate aminotransferase